MSKGKYYKSKRNRKKVYSAQPDYLKREAYRRKQELREKQNSKLPPGNYEGTLTVTGSDLVMYYNGLDNHGKAGMMTVMSLMDNPDMTDEEIQERAEGFKNILDGMDDSYE